MISYKHIFQFSPFPILVIKDGKVLHCNQAAVDLTKIIPKDGDLSFDLLSPTPTGILRDDLSQIIKEFAISKHKKLENFKASLSILASAKKVGDYIILYIEDPLNGKLAYSDWIESIQHINRQISHEIKTPLSTILLNLSFMSKKLKSSSHLLSKSPCSLKEIKEIIDESILQATYIADILKGLADYSSPDPESHESLCNIGLVVRSVVSLMRKASVLKDLHYGQLITNLDDICGLYVKINKVRLHQIVWNLCINAYEAIDKNGKIYILGKKQEETNSAILIVSNTGQISEDTMKHMFNPFFTTKPKEPGKIRGLGLAVVKKHVSAAGGKIWVSSSKGYVNLIVRFPIQDYLEDLKEDNQDCDVTESLPLIQIEDCPTVIRALDILED